MPIRRSSSVESFGLMLAVSLSAMTTGCSGNDALDEQGAVAPPVPTPPTARELAPRPDALYDQDGNLLPSDVRVSGIILPRGLNNAGQSERRAFFESSVPVEALQRYFGPRLITGEVEPVGSGILYHRAAPRDTEGSPIRVDVLIAPSSAAVSAVTITEYEQLQPGAARPPTPEELEARMREDALR